MSVKIFIAAAVSGRASAATLRMASAIFASATTTARRMLRAEGSLFTSTAARTVFSLISFTARRSYRLRVRRSEPSRCSSAKSCQALRVASEMSLNVSVIPPSPRRTTLRPTPGAGVQLSGLGSFMSPPVICANYNPGALFLQQFNCWRTLRENSHRATVPSRPARPRSWGRLRF